VGRSIDRSLGLGNEDIYVIVLDAMPTPRRRWLWDAFLSVGLEPNLDLVGIEPQ
jgi:hypothetical protein